MKQCAVVIDTNGNEIIKYNNLKKKWNKLQNHSTLKILEECDLEELETKYNYYKELYKKEEVKESEDVKLYYYKYIDGSDLWLISIYSNEEENKPVLKKTKEEYREYFGK